MVEAPGQDKVSVEVFILPQASPPNFSRIRWCRVSNSWIFDAQSGSEVFPADAIVSGLRLSDFFFGRRSTPISGDSSNRGAGADYMAVVRNLVYEWLNEDFRDIRDRLHELLILVD